MEVCMLCIRPSLPLFIHKEGEKATPVCNVGMLYNGIVSTQPTETYPTIEYFIVSISYNIHI